MAWKTHDTPLTALKLERDFQPRALGLNDTQVAKYREAMARGDVFPPISVARLKGLGLCIIDGFHRYEATRHLGRPTILASIATMSRQQALMFAIQANAKHPLPISRSDKQRAFEVYHANGLYLRPNGDPKSLAEIRKDLQDMWSRQTISTHLKRYGIQPTQDEGPSVAWDKWHNPDDDEHRTPEMEKLEDVNTYLGSLLTAYTNLEDAENRRLIRERIALMHKELEMNEADYAGPQFLDI